MWLNKFSPCVEGSKERIAEALLWGFHFLGLCCTIAGEFAMYISGKLISPFDVITINIACHRQKWSADISVFFCKGNVHLLFLTTVWIFCSFPNARYQVKCFILLSGME